MDGDEFYRYVYPRKIAIIMIVASVNLRVMLCGDGGSYGC